MSGYWANEYTRRIAEEIYLLGDPVGEDFHDSVMNMAEHGYSRTEAVGQLEWEIENYFRDVHAELYRRASPMERIALEDFDAMQIDFGQIAEGFISDYPPSEVCNGRASCNRRPRATVKAKERCRR